MCTVWRIMNLTDNDLCEILAIYYELLDNLDGKDGARDQISFKPEGSDWWLCFGIGPHCIMVCLTDAVDETGTPRGAIYMTADLALDYVMDIVGRRI